MLQYFSPLLPLVLVVSQSQEVRNLQPYFPTDHLPDGATEYQSAKYTQSISILNDRDVVVPTHIRWVDAKWHQSGGMAGLTGWTSRKYKTLPEGTRVVSRIASIQVKNSYGYFQPNRGIVRSYPDGTRFDDVLATAKGVFEHRMREKVDGKWESSVIYRNVANRPQGYTGLKVTCGSCHEVAGTGGYNAGLVPGGDTVLSDPLDWSVFNPRWKREEDLR